MRRVGTGSAAAGRLLSAAILAAFAISSCRAEPTRSGILPQRIIAVAPNIVEILYELEVEKRLVGVGNYCVWPPEVSEKPRIGGLLDPKLEEIVRLEPDLAILLPSEAELAGALEDLGIEVLVTPIETIGDVAVAVEAIGRRTGVEEQARALVARMRDGIEPRAVATGRRALLVVGREPGALTDIYAAAPGTFLDELLGRLGAVNAFADSPARYPRVALEEILLRSPPIVVELQPEALSAAVRERLITDWRQAMPEARPCVTVIEGDHVLVPGPRLPLLYRDLAAGLEACGGRGA